VQPEREFFLSVVFRYTAPLETVNAFEWRDFARYV